MNPSPDASLPGIAHYTFVRQLGQGRFCVVHLGRHFYTDKLYAVKVIDKQAHKPDILLRLRREIELMELLDHPNIVKLYEVIETQFTIYVCMEYVEGCSLEQYLKSQEHGKIGEREARRITRELASAVAHCHSRYVVHRDIKPANILITLNGGKVMLIDFGLGNTFSYRSRLNTICGSLPYYSPEIARGSSYTGPEVDIWCMGVVLYRMTIGRDPFGGATKREVKLQIIQDGFHPPATLSVGLQNTLRILLAGDTSRRRSLAILENDPWLYEDAMNKDGQLQQNQPYPRFMLSEDRSLSETSRLSGTTLVRQASKATTATVVVNTAATTKSSSLKRLSLTESCYYYGKTGSLFGSRSLLADTLGAGVWQMDAHQPRFRKNRIRIVPCPGARNELLFQKNVDLSLLQFLLPVLRSCNVSYYIHSATRILCGTSFFKDDLSPTTWSEEQQQYQEQGSRGRRSNSMNSGGSGGGMLLQKLVHQLGAAMTGGGNATTFQFSSSGGLSSLSKQGPATRCGVFSIDIVKKMNKNGAHVGQVLIIKRLFGSSLTVQYFKKQFLFNATPHGPAMAAAYLT